ncbi:mitochondrial ribosomal protein S25, partial [Cladochytrium replicatum]
RLQLNPFALAQNAENFAEAGRTKALPKWYPAAQLFPPHLLPLRTVIPSETGQYVDPTKKNTDCTAFVLDGRRRRWSDKKTAKSYWRNHPQYVHFPKVIEYPEDDLRRRFYKYHPFELKRPIHLMEKDDTSNVERDWSTIWGGNIPVKQMTGECVIKHTMYLMTRKVTPLDTETAYQTALQAFYQAQREQEYAQLQRRKEA